MKTDFYSVSTVGNMMLRDVFTNATFQKIPPHFQSSSEVSGSIPFHSFPVPICPAPPFCTFVFWGKGFLILVEVEGLGEVKGITGLSKKMFFS